MPGKLLQPIPMWRTEGASAPSIFSPHSRLLAEGPIPNKFRVQFNRGARQSSVHMSSKGLVTTLIQPEDVTMKISVFWKLRRHHKRGVS